METKNQYEPQVGMAGSGHLKKVVIIMVIPCQDRKLPFSDELGVDNKYMYVPMQYNLMSIIIIFLLIRCCTHIKKVFIKHQGQLNLIPQTNKFIETISHYEYFFIYI